MLRFSQSSGVAKGFSFGLAYTEWRSLPLCCTVYNSRSTKPMIDFSCKCSEFWLVESGKFSPFLNCALQWNLSGQAVNLE